MSEVRLQLPDDLKEDLHEVLGGRSLEEFSLEALRRQVERERFGSGEPGSDNDRERRLEQICRAAFSLRQEDPPRFTALDLLGILGPVGSIGDDEAWSDVVEEQAVAEHERGLDA